MLTEHFKVPYDEDRLSVEEADELERFMAELFGLLVAKVAEMGLSMTDLVITKFSKEELEGMPVAYRDKDGVLRSMTAEPSFIDDLMEGTATFSDIDKYVEYWHIHDTGRTLQDFLGLTDEEFEEWGKSSNECLDKVIGNATERSVESGSPTFEMSDCVKE